MRVVILILEYEPIFTDGRVVRMKCFAEYLRDKGVQVSIVHLSDHDSELHENGISTFGVKYPGLSNISRNRPGSNLPGRWFTESLRRLSRLVFPDRYFLSLARIARKIREITEPGDTLVVSMPLFSPLLMFYAKQMVSSELDVVFDYRDLWVNNKIFVRNKLENWAAQKIEAKALSKARAVMVTTGPAEHYFKEQGVGTVWLVRNGITLQDYEVILSAKREYSFTGGGSTKDPKKMVIGYFGNIGNRRNAEDLLNTLKTLDVDLRVFGSIDEKHRTICESSYKGAVSRTKALQQAAQCDILLVIIRAAEHSSHAMPGKLFEYMALNKPILLFCPPDALIAEWLTKYDYPHMLIDSESPKQGLASLRDNLTKFGKNRGHAKVVEEAIPIREREFEVVYKAIYSWQGMGV